MLRFTILLLTLSLVTSMELECLDKIEAKLKEYGQILKSGQIQSKPALNKEEWQESEQQGLEDKGASNTIIDAFNNGVSTGTNLIISNNPINWATQMIGGNTNGLTIAQQALGNLVNSSQQVNTIINDITANMAQVGPNIILGTVGGVSSGGGNKVNPSLKAIMADIGETVSHFESIIMVIYDMFNVKTTKP